MISHHPWGGFQETEIRYARRREGESPIDVVLKTPAKIRGLPSELTA